MCKHKDLFSLVDHVNFILLAFFRQFFWQIFRNSHRGVLTAHNSCFFSFLTFLARLLKSQFGKCPQVHLGPTTVDSWFWRNGTYLFIHHNWEKQFKKLRLQRWHNFKLVISVFSHLQNDQQKFFICQYVCRQFLLWTFLRWPGRKRKSFTLIILYTKYQ